MIYCDDTKGSVSFSLKGDFLFEEVIRKFLLDGFWVHVTKSAELKDGTPEYKVEIKEGKK